MKNICSKNMEFDFVAYRGWHGDRVHVGGGRDEFSQRTPKNILFLEEVINKQ